LCTIGAVSEVTRILGSIAPGDPKAAEELLPLVYEELRKLAAQKMAAEPPGQTLQPTALVHEVWLRLGGKPGARFANQAHFFAAAAEAMRRILVENVRRKQRLKHGDGQRRVDLGRLDVAITSDADHLLAANGEAGRRFVSTDLFGLGFMSSVSHRLLRR
jgi:RNA polymerase sigma factor (TIGR02999 family)